MKPKLFDYFIWWRFQLRDAYFCIEIFMSIYFFFGLAPFGCGEKAWIKVENQEIRLDGAISQAVEYPFPGLS
jgi:hypothetical protein